jgi:hypothetical protein
LTGLFRMSLLDVMAYLLLGRPGRGILIVEHPLQDSLITSFDAYPVN